MNDSVNYPNHSYSKEEAHNQLAWLVWLDHPGRYPFDEFHSHEYCEVFVFEKGGGKHNMNFKDYPIQDFSIHILAASDLHWIERGMNSKGFVILFKEEFLQNLAFINPEVSFARNFFSSRVINFNLEQQLDFDGLFQELKNNKENRIYEQHLIGACLTKIALKFPLEASLHKPYDNLLKKFIELINKKFKQRLSVQQYAFLLNTSSSSLRKKVKKYTGKTVSEIQEDRLFKEAKRMLHQPEYSIAQIAEELNFKQPAHFSSWFKRKEGLSPSTYR